MCIVSEKKDKKSKKKVINNILLIVIFMLLSYLFISGIQFSIGYFRKYNISVDNETLKYIEKESKIIDANMKKIKNMKSNNLSEKDIEIINERLNDIYKNEKNLIKMVKSNKKYNFAEIYFTSGYTSVVEEILIIKTLEKDETKLNYFRGLMGKILFNHWDSNDLLRTNLLDDELEDFRFNYKIRGELKSLRYLTDLVLEAGDNNE